MKLPTHDAFGRPWKPHHIEFRWYAPDPSKLEGWCRDCDEAVCSPPVANDYYAIRHAECQIRAILEETPCWPDRRGPFIVGGGR